MSKRSRRYAWLTLLYTSALFIACALLGLYLAKHYYELPLRIAAFRFQRPWAALLFLAPLLAWIAQGYLSLNRSPRFLAPFVSELAHFPKSIKTQLSPLVPALRVCALCFVVIALMRPQSIHAKQSTQSEGIDIVLAMDLSLSMQAADIVPNRFVASTQVVADFIERRPSDRIGAVIFGKNAYTLMPLTTDKTALLNAILELQLGIIDGKGTAIGNAVGVALNRLRPSEAKSKVVIVLTDGNSNAGNIAPEQAAEYAKTMGVKIYTVLMGQSDDALVQRGKGIFGFALMDRGEFPINPELLEKMATETGGKAFLATDRKGLVRSFHRILDDLERSKIEESGAVYGELFILPVAFALWLLFIEVLLSQLWLRRWP
ncbi:MAG: VWA domain-containing protein [Myxococcales bacterium]|nr:MAG: VWA domain-containing protein [Myxococcales bacterium]